MLKAYKKLYERMGKLSKDAVRKTSEVHWLCYCQVIGYNT